MKINVYSIFDSAAEVYGRPFFMPTDAMALRTFSDMAKDSNHEVGRHPEHYTLFRLGTFTDVKGALMPETPKSLANGVEFVSVEDTVSNGVSRALEN